MPLNVVEEGAKWPDSATAARAALLPERKAFSVDPLEHRVLFMPSTTYRAWAKIRLKHIQPWIEEWRLDENYSGVEGLGAADAAYETAIKLELRRLKKEDFSGGAADIFKCFDQINRPLVYKLLKKAGLPEKVLRAYQNFQEGLKVRDRIAGGIGKE